MPKKCKHTTYATLSRAEKAAWALAQKCSVEFIVGRCGYCGELRIYRKHAAGRDS